MWSVMTSMTEQLLLTWQPEDWVAMVKDTSKEHSCNKPVSSIRRWTNNSQSFTGDRTFADLLIFWRQMLLLLTGRLRSWLQLLFFILQVRQPTMEASKQTIRHWGGVREQMWGWTKLYSMGKVDIAPAYYHSKRKLKCSLWKQLQS